MTDIQTRYDSSGRIQPIEFRNLWHPGTCALCARIGRSSDEHFANLQVELEFYGSIYLCLDCCAEVGDFIRMIPREKMELLALERDNLAQALASANNENVYLRGLLNARIDSAGSSESDGYESASVPLFEVDDSADELDRILNPDESVAS